MARRLGELHEAGGAAVVLLRDEEGHGGAVGRVLEGLEEVLDDEDRLIGMFKQKFFTIGGAFTVLDVDEQPVCELKGKWTGWDFRFLAGQNELAHVSKQWAGIGQEMFTTADTYVLQISDHVPAENVARQLIFAAVMCIDMVLKE